MGKGSVLIKVFSFVLPDEVCIVFSNRVAAIEDLQASIAWLCASFRNVLSVMLAVCKKHCTLLSCGWRRLKERKFSLKHNRNIQDLQNTRSEIKSS